MIAIDLIRSDGVVAVVREPTAPEAAEAVERLLTGGLRAVEVSLVTPDALDVVRSVAGRIPGGAVIGVGTVLTVGQARAAASAGASFIVSPTLDVAVVREAIALGMDALPGVATPTEAYQAVQAGANAVKLFPASLWSPTALRDVRAALPWLETVPTGGVGLFDIDGWIRAGASAVGLGSALTRASDPAQRIARVLDAVRAARAGA